MKVCLCGLGRAGKEFVRYIAENPLHELTAVLCRNESKSAHQSVSKLTEIAVDPNLYVQRIADFSIKTSPVDVVIDFSGCSTSMELVDLCCKNGINIVICPTDFTQEQIEVLKEKTRTNNIGLVLASTLTSGINLVIDFVERLSDVFPDFNFEIIERHPHNKPAPTKTATYIRNAIKRENVPIASVRLDGYVGIHEITATDGYERISLTHESFSRAAFVRGALIAAQFIVKRKGFFTMREVIQHLMLEKA